MIQVIHLQVHKAIVTLKLIKMNNVNKIILIASFFVGCSSSVKITNDDNSNIVNNTKAMFYLNIEELYYNYDSLMALRIRNNFNRLIQTKPKKCYELHAEVDSVIQLVLTDYILPNSSKEIIVETLLGLKKSHDDNKSVNQFKTEIIVAETYWVSILTHHINKATPCLDRLAVDIKCDKNILDLKQEGNVDIYLFGVKSRGVMPFAVVRTTNINTGDFVVDTLRFKQGDFPVISFKSVFAKEGVYKYNGEYHIPLYNTTLKIPFESELITVGM